MDITTTLAQEFGLKQEYSQNIINLLDEGCTIPFIARYRKEMHGTCDDQTLRAFADRLKYLRNLNDEKAKVEKAITEQGKWTDEIKVALDNAKTLTEVEEISMQLHNLYLDYTNFVEPLGLDECWLDVTDSLKYLKMTGKQIADELRAKVKEKFGFTVSIGVSFSKIFAKLGSDMRKPDFTTEISKSKFKEITYPLPLNSIVGIGRRLEKKFASIDVYNIGDFVKLDDDYLVRLMGITGLRLKQDLLGEREEPVADYYTLPPPKSVGNGTTTLKDIVTRDDVKKVVYFLAEKVSYRLIKHKVKAGVLSITLKDKDLKTYHKSQKIVSTNSIDNIAKGCMALADKIWKYNYPLRAIRIKGSMLTSANVWQISMFDDVKPDISETLRFINDKYGKIELASSMAEFINKNSHPQE